MYVCVDLHVRAACGPSSLLSGVDLQLTTWLRPTKLDLAYPLRVVPTLVYGIVPVGNNVGPVSIGWAIGPIKSVGPIQSNLVAALSSYRVAVYSHRASCKLHVGKPCSTQDVGTVWQ